MGKVPHEVDMELSLCDRAMPFGHQGWDSMIQAEEAMGINSNG